MIDSRRWFVKQNEFQKIDRAKHAKLAKAPHPLRFLLCSCCSLASFALFARDSFFQHSDFLSPRRKGAKFGYDFLLKPSRLSVFGRDIPFSSFALFAPFAVKFSDFEFLFAALPP
jgi:hypothetical protein